MSSLPSLGDILPWQFALTMLAVTALTMLALSPMYLDDLALLALHVRRSIHSLTFGVVLCRYILITTARSILRRT